MPSRLEASLGNSFDNRVQGSRARELMIAKAREHVLLTSPTDISPVNSSPRSERAHILRVLGPSLVVPFLIAACSSTSSQPQARQIESSPTVPVSTPTPKKCDPVEFAKGYPTPLPIGGENDPQIAQINAIYEQMKQKIQKCEPALKEQETIEVFNRERAPKTPVSVPPAPPEASVKPAATATVASKPDPMKEATPQPENPLPRYSVFFGNVTDPKTGAKVAEMVMASIPQKEGPDEIFKYYITVLGPAGGRTHSAGQSKPINLKGTHFEIGGRINIWEKADFNEETKTISGETHSISGNPASGFESAFALKLVGTGKEAILKAMRQVISDLSSDQPTTPERELELYKIKADLWP
ncbi:MAG: hypothetical protein Q8P89_00665 [bacterium]|nr:hypothetical protein [bacterium]